MINRLIEDVDIVYNIQFWDCYNDEMIEETQEETDAHERLVSFLTRLEQVDLDLVEKGLKEIKQETYSESYEDCDGYLYYDTINVFNVFDIHKGGLEIFDKTHKIPIRAFDIIKKIQEQLNEE